VQVTRATFIPLLASGNTQHLDAGVVREDYCADLTLVYSLGPPFGRRVVTQADMEQMELTPRTLRRAAFEELEMLAIERAQYHGQPPSLMLSFDGLESSLLLATEFWSRLQGILPGELVVGVPARDVVIVTGSQLPAGLEKVRRAVDRVFFAGDENLLTRSLLVRRGGTWEPFDRPARPTATRPAAHAHTADQPPRQYQEHQSWPGERVPVASARGGRPMTAMPGDRPIGRPSPGPMAPGPLAPAASTGMPRPAATSLPPMPASPPMPTAAPMPMPTPTMAPRPTPMSPTGLPSRVPPMSRSGPLMSPAASQTSSMPATGPMATGPMATGPAVVGPMGMGPMATGPSPTGGTVSRTGTHAARMPDLARRAEQARLDAAAQYSAMPYSAVPQSSVPYSSVPYSAMPSSAVPSSAVPSSAMPYSAMPYGSGRSSAPVSPGYPQPAFSRGARSRHSQAKPAYRDDPYPTSGGSYTGQHVPVSPAPYPYSAPPGTGPTSPPPYGGPSYPGSGHAPNPPYQGHTPRDYERDASHPQGYPSWSETSANDTFSGLFARSETPSGRSGFDGRSGPRARFTR
jgi:hypothetical protein